VDITRAEFKADPFPLYAQLRKDQPVFAGEDGAHGGLAADALRRRAGGAQRTRGWRRVSGGAGGGGAVEASVDAGVSASAREQHARPGRSESCAAAGAGASSVYAGCAIERLQQRIEAIAGELLDAVQRRGELELVRDFALPLPLTVIGELLGVSAGGQRAVSRACRKLLLLPPTTLNVLRMLPAAWG
jgi:hypothetical protein